MSSNSDLREVLELAKSLGLTVDGVEQSKHFKVLVTTPRGAKRILTVSITKSDRRAFLNNKSILTRWGKE
jgi:hypothetical protein